MNTYKVHLVNKEGNTVGAVRVQVETKADAPAEAARVLVRTAKEYNAKYSEQGLPQWAFMSEDPADYIAWGTIRKVQPRKVAA